MALRDTHVPEAVTVATVGLCRTERSGSGAGALTDQAHGLLGAGGQDSSSTKKQVAAPKRKRGNWASQPTGTRRKKTLLFKKGLFPKVWTVTWEGREGWNKGRGGPLRGREGNFS